MNIYLLQLRSVFLKDSTVIPLKCNHQEGLSLWEDRILTLTTASKQTLLA